MSRRAATTAANAKRVRCAIYTRKSSEEGLEQEFNSLDAQRESAEAYIASQKSDGWICLPERYDDGGFTGGNIERPALQRLLADIGSGAIDCVVVYKVDRLSRSLLDFTKIMETFERHGVSFVSVTQAFNTRDSMGRLMLNVLLSFAQFEREIIGERIRDKIGAQRRKGKWAGGKPVLGYDLDRSAPGGSPRLIVNPEEASRVRTIFELYLEKGSMLPVVEELGRRGWTNKLWVTKAGQQAGGRAFDRPSLHQLLTNPILVGRIVHKGNQFRGEHEPVVSEEIFAKVQRQLHANGRAGATPRHDGAGAMLRGRLRCRACDCAMVHVLAGKGMKRYRYYVCSKANRTSRANCPGGSLPAAEIERVVLEQIATVMHLPGATDAIVDVVRNATENAAGDSEVLGMLKDFESIWASLSPTERSRVLDLVVERIEYDAGDSSIEVQFRAAFIAEAEVDLMEAAA